MTNRIKVQLDQVSLHYPILGARRVTSRPQAGHSSMGKISSSPNGPHGIAALNEISFQLRSGDRMALVGKNGAGKTTLLKVIAGIYSPSAGNVLTEGKIATLFQMGMGMRPTATGYRNILLQGLIQGHSKQEISALTEDIEEFTELGEFLNLPVNTYSQGMAMRLNFAVATAMHPDILIMDEWLGAGDATFREKAAKRMNDVFENAGIAILASHNKNLLRRVCNKALWLDSGRQMAFGEIDAVLVSMEKFYSSDSYSLKT